MFLNPASTGAITGIVIAVIIVIGIIVYFYFSKGKSPENRLDVSPLSTRSVEMQYVGDIRAPRSVPILTGSLRDDGKRNVEMIDMEAMISR